MRGEPKVTSSHRERTAICYIRQSSLVQVREHTESTARQYGLAALAARLGWPAARIEVIDADLGLSGRSATYREGFKELVARVCMGEVGAVFGLEVSRLARSNADLARLLELARLTDTLVVDSDGVYELSDINDRLLLGLKSQMSEAELHWLTSRLNESKRAAARRGELRVPLPVGFVHDDDGAVVIDPDQEVAAAVADVFAAFTATGSAYGVAGAFAGRRFPRRAYGGVWAGQVRWGRLTHARAAGILRNPVYAGAYVFGRRRTRQVVHPDGSVHSATTELPRDQWEVLIPGHHAGYITFEAYLANEAKLAANRTNAGARPPREGSALCQGIVFCGACGRSMQVRYQDRYPRYECSHSRADHVATPQCGSVRADTIDQAVTAALLAAVEPGQLALALAAAGEVTARRRRADRAAELAVERARYDADRAERAFLACEPENRLVARSLEARWETRLTDLAQAEAALATQLSAQPELPSPGSWPPPSPTCPPCGQRRPPATRTASACCAPCSATSPSPRRPATPRSSRSGCAGNPGPASSSPHPPQKRHPAARHRPGRHRARLPHRPRHGQQRPGRRAQRCRAPHRHRAALRRRRRRQPAQLPPHPLPRPARRRRAHPPPGRRAHRRVHRHHPLLDQRRYLRRPPRPGRPVGHPLPARRRGRLPRPRHRLRPPAPRHRPRPAGRRRAQHRRGRPPARRQARRRLRMGRMGPPARPPRPRRAAMDPFHPRCRAGMPPANRQLVQAPRRQSKPKPHNAWKGKQYEAHVPTVADRIAQTVVAMELEKKSGTKNSTPTPMATGRGGPRWMRWEHAEMLPGG